MGRAMQGAGAALLAGVVRTRREAQEGEDLGDGAATFSWELR
jgi:hypothetical protein